MQQITVETYMTKNLIPTLQNEILLDVKNIGIKFGGLKAVENFSMQIPQGSLCGLIGPNGAGKTTVFNLLTGVYTPDFGTIHLNINQNKILLNGLKPYEVSQYGLARTFQNIRLFKELSVLENILTGLHHFSKSSLFSAVLRTPHFLKEEKTLIEKAYSLLSIFKLQDKAHTRACSLPYGEQRKLEILRALATDPKIILLDEPAAGMNHSETHDLMETIARIRNEYQLTVLLIEHDMKLVMGICENIHVLDHGLKIAEGTSREVQTNPKVIEAYLGPEET